MRSAARLPGKWGASRESSLPSGKIEDTLVSSIYEREYATFGIRLSREEGKSFQMRTLL